MAVLHNDVRHGAAVAVLHNDVLPFYQEREIPVTKIQTDDGREYCGTEATQTTHPFELYLVLNDIRHKRTKVARLQSNGFVERFHRTVLDEFFPPNYVGYPAFRATLYLSVVEVQADFDGWLQHYNRERPHQGYRNLGRRPVDTVNEFLALTDWKERCLTPTTSTTVSQGT